MQGASGSPQLEGHFWPKRKGSIGLGASRSRIPCPQSAYATKKLSYGRNTPSQLCTWECYHRAKALLVKIKRVERATRTEPTSMAKTELVPRLCIAATGKLSTENRNQLRAMDIYSCEAYHSLHLLRPFRYRRAVAITQPRSWTLVCIAKHNLKCILLVKDKPWV